MIPFNSFIFLSLFLSILYFTGVLFFLTDYELDKCLMTYMYEYPQFVKISESRINKTYRKYGLYAYSEGKLTSKVRNMHFDGIPVVFVPGNAGSHKQVRSLSSVALRIALNSRMPYHFDYFTVDLNGESSGIYGPLLNDQLFYVNNSIYRVLELYKGSRNPPNSVILIGHSMGGVIAKKLLSMMPSSSELISVLITLAAPLKRPPVFLDRSIHTFYNRRKNIYNSSTTTIINLSGGYSDFLIPPDLSWLQGESSNYSLDVVTTNIPRSWVEANHVQILWCKQTVLAINRALFDSVDVKTKQISVDPNYRLTVFHHHLVHNSGIKIREFDKYQEITNIDYRGEWIEDIRRQYSVNFTDGVRQPHWYMVSFTLQPTYEILTVLAVNLEVTDWVFACNAAYPKGPSKVCIDGQHLTQFSEIAPSARLKRRLLTVNMHHLKRSNPDLTHIVFRALPTSESVAFHVDVYGLYERKIEVKLPHWWHLGKTDIIEVTNERAVRYDLELPGLTHILQFYQLFVEPVKCSTDFYHATASLNVPWANHDVHVHFTETEKKPLNVRLFSKNPSNSTASAKIRLILEPNCSYRIRIKFSIFGVLGQFARHYSLMLFTNAAVVVLLTLVAQLESIKKSGKCSIFFVAMKNGAKPYFILTTVKILSKLFSVPVFENLFPKPHPLFLTNDLGLDFILVPVILYTVSVGIVWISAILYCVSLVALESTVHRLCLKLLAKSVSFTIAWSDYLMQFLQKVPLFVVGTLFFLCVSTCGGLALCVGLVFYFLKLTQMSQDFIEEVVWFVVKNFAKKLKEKLRRKDNSTNADNKTTQREERNAEQNENEQFKITSIEESSNNFEPNSSCLNEKAKDKQETISENNTVEQTVTTNINNQTILDNNEEQNITRERKNQNNEEDTSDKTFVSAYNEIFFHSTLFFIWVLITLLNVPAVLTWAHNFSYSKKLSPDESFLPGIILSICAFPIWHFDLPKTNRKYVDKLQKFIQSVSIISIMYAIHSLYILNYLLTLTFAMVVLHQIFAPKISDLSEIESNSDFKSEEKASHKKYDNIKKKID